MPVLLPLVLKYRSERSPPLCNTRRHFLLFLHARKVILYRIVYPSFLGGIDKQNQHIVNNDPSARYCSKNNAGKHNAAGLPNVTGELASGQNQSNDPAAVASNGGANNAFTNGGATAHSKATITTTATVRNSISISFLASRSNGIYGASTTVMPASVETPIALYLGRPTKV